MAPFQAYRGTQTAATGDLFRIASTASFPKKELRMQERRSISKSSFFPNYEGFNIRFASFHMEDKIFESLNVCCAFNQSSIFLPFSTLYHSVFVE